MKSFYLHVPYCLHLCNYCDFYKKPFKKSFKEYEKYLESTWLQTLQEHQDQLEPLKTLYLGGGTPSLWTSQFFEDFFLPKISFEQNYEWTMEIDPYNLDLSNIQRWMNIGVNRLSFGIQSLNNKALKILDRQHSREDVIQILHWLKDKNVNYSVDFLIGIPIERDILSELEEVLSFNPSNMSTYILTVPQSYTHYKFLPEDQLIVQEYLAVKKYLESKKFLHYEVSNYGKILSQHNQVYWNQESYMAMGPSASGYCSVSKKRYKWLPNKTIEQDILTEEAFILESFYLGLRQFTIKTEYLKSFKNLKDLEEEGFLKGNKILPKGILLLDFIAQKLSLDLRAY